MFTQPDTRLTTTDLHHPALDALLHLTNAVGSASTPGAVCDAALDGIQQALGVERGAILLLHADGAMRFEAWRGLSDGLRASIEPHAPWKLGDETPHPVLVPDVHVEPSFWGDAGVFACERVGALAFFPLSSRRQVIGAVMLVWCEPHELPPAEVFLALTIGLQTGSAVERTRSEIRSSTDHQRLLFALDAAQMGTWEWDVRTERVRWSDNLERIHGLPSGTFDGRFASYEREIHPDDRARVMASLQRALTDGTVHDVEYRIVGPDGGIRWVHGKGRVERDPDGRPVTMSGVCMDVSVRKRAELDIASALEKEASVRDRLTVLATGSQQLLTTLDTDSVVRHLLSLAPRVVAADAYAVWRRAGDVWRVAASQGLSDDFTAVSVTSGHRTMFDRPIVAEDVLRTPLLDVRHALYAREGIQSLVSVPLIVRGDHAGSIVFYHRVPYRPSDVELHVAMALGQLAAAAMSNAELYHEAQEANRLKDEFLATLSHELRTPLNVMLGRTRMLQRTATTESMQAALGTIERNGAALTRLVEDLLDLSRITLGSLRLESGAVNMSEVVEAAVQGILPAASAKSVGLHVDADRPAVSITGDATRLQQVVWNLLVNAVKFTPPGGRVTLSLAAEPADLVLHVSDTGAGIDPAFLPHVFEMFRQAPPAAERHHGGLGVGLSIVRRLVELHGGTVAASSAGVGQGATFTVRLPR